MRTDDCSPPPVIRMSTDDVDVRHRPQLVGDVMARELAGGAVSQLAGHELRCEWALAPIGPGTVIAEARQRGMVGERGPAELRDGDDDLSIFFGRSGVAFFEQNDRRELLGPGEAIVVAHSRAVSSRWADGGTRVIRLPRAALGAAVPIERAGGVKIAASPGVALLTAYLGCAWSLAAAGTVPAVAGRHLADLAALVVAEAVGAAGPTPREAIGAARVAAMREVMLRRFADPRLTMAIVAAAVGISARAGYLVFEAAGIGFSDALAAVRLDRARERLAGGDAGKIVDLALDVGFTDLSHFNRQFRRRFGATPRELRAR